MVIILFLFFHFLISVTSKQYPSPFTCNFGAGKCPGQMLRNYFFVKSKGPPPKVLPSPNEINCSLICTFNVDCWVATFEKFKCALYPKNVSLTLGGPTLAYVWQCCNDNTDCREEPHRCRGYWLLRQLTYVSGPAVLQTLELKNQPDKCRSKCIETPVCAGVNYINNAVCELLFFSSSRKVIALNTSSENYEWHCCSRNDNDLSKEWKTVSGKCTGRWQAEQSGPNPSERLVANIFAMGKFECMDACNKNPYCSKVFVNNTYAKCLMMSGAKAEPNGTQCSSDKLIFNRNISWSAYSWKCNNQSENPIEPVDPNLPSQYGPCVCLNTSEVGSIEISRDGCTEPLLDSTISLNSDMAAFWLPEERQAQVNEKPWTRVFNGKDYFWINRALSNLTICPTGHCHLFSPTDVPKTCPELVTRSEWFAAAPTGNMDRFVVTPSVAIILNTVCPIWGCYSLAACSSYIRTLQKFPVKRENMADLPYNYVIGEDGRAYVGRGSKYVGAHTYGYNSNSLGIAFIGWFQNRKPSVKAMITFRRLLKCLVEEGNITTTYQISAHRDLRPNSVVPGYYLYELLPSLSHYDEKIPKGLPCDLIYARKLKRLIIIVSGSAGGLLFLIILSVMYGKVYRHHKWCPLRKSRFKKVSNISMICSVGREDILHQQMATWQSNCTIRQPKTFYVHPTSTELTAVLDRSCNCQCFRYAHLLWTRCHTDATNHFTGLLYTTIASQKCRRYSVLVLTDTLYFIHVTDLNLLRTAIEAITHNCCLCKLKFYVTLPIKVPNLEKYPALTEENVLSKMRELRNDQVYNCKDLDVLCRAFIRNGDVIVEETYETYRNRYDSNPEDPTALEISEQELNVATPLLM